MKKNEEFCLKWNNHQPTIVSAFETLLKNGAFADCTLAAEGKFIKAHKFVLSACSSYFEALLSQQCDKHTIFILKDITFEEMRALMEYMYKGKVNVPHDQLSDFLNAAKSLQIKGLAESQIHLTQEIHRVEENEKATNEFAEELGSSVSSDKVASSEGVAKPEVKVKSAEQHQSPTIETPVPMQMKRSSKRRCKAKRPDDVGALLADNSTPPPRKIKRNSTESTVSHEVSASSTCSKRKGVAGLGE